MRLKKSGLLLRIALAIVAGCLLLRCLHSGMSIRWNLDGSGSFAGLVLAILYGGLLFALFGLPLIRRIGEGVTRLYEPSDSSFRIVPEYSVAEARAKEGNYSEAIEEYRKVIAEHPNDIFARVRIADLALTNLGDVKLAERELRKAFKRARGEDSSALVANRLADLYQHNLHNPDRAMWALEQLYKRLPGTKAAARAEERILSLSEFVAGKEPLKRPTKIAHRITDAETLRKRRGF